jgi:acyl-CoA dehydrogenase
MVSSIERGSAAERERPPSGGNGGMSFEDTPEEARFRSEVRAWLAANAPKKRSDDDSRGGGLYDAEGLAEAKKWQAKKAAAGYACITWPKEFGGRGGKAIEEVIYSQEAAGYPVPESHFGIGLGMCIPTLMTYGKPDHHERYVRPALYGEEIWCQLFSEPAAGSDVAGIRTRAVRDGDDWVLNGQKIWTSGAQYSDFGLIIARTDPDVPKHKGMTMFFLDMKSPGVEVRPIRQANGAKEFNEVFFADVRVPDDQRLGAVGEGWKVALTTLMHERKSVGGGGVGFVSPEQALEVARRVPRNGRSAADDPAVREQVAEWYVVERGLRFTYYRALTALSKGETPGPEQSIQKVARMSQSQQIAYFVMDLLDEAGILTSDSLGEAWGPVETTWWWAAALRIAGGSDEILRNIISERVLGLPGDVRVDKDVPFSRIA